jgi:flavin reductase (DIM6/NTAB) family NADH-FMN oxidoreductase RutF
LVPSVVPGVATLDLGTMTRKLKLAEASARDFRSALGSFATGVTIVTTAGPRSGDYIGITANSFASVSLNPPLVLFSVARQSRSVAAFQVARHVAVNVLSRQQLELCRRFARSANDKWEGIGFELWDHGCPILPGSVASFECAIQAVHEGGDHIILVGHVEHMATDPAAEPLLFLKGAYGHFQAGD